MLLSAFFREKDTETDLRENQSGYQQRLTLL